MKAIMIQGTGSHVGKSVAVAAVCRILAADGYSVCPFKSQNMALNSYVTSGGGEMGRAQVMQAEAAGLEPSVLMNPILIKPVKDTAAQIIFMGKVLKNMSASEYDSKKKLFLAKIRQIIGELKSKYDYLVIEGAGSPAEINLLENDIVNMKTAELAESPVILAADIDKGGVFASFYGTVRILPERYQRYFRGLLINKFRGDKKLLRPGIEWIEEKLRLPVIGTIPYFNNIVLDEEDSVNLEKQEEKNKVKAGRLRVAVLYLPHISNFTDFNALEIEKDIDLSYVKTAAQLKRAEPHLIIIPGSKSTMADLTYLKETGIADTVISMYRKGASIIGVCGGYQMLGSSISDRHRAESDMDRIKGLGLLDTRTEFFTEKSTHQVEFEADYSIFGKKGEKEVFKGYEIHMGDTISEKSYGRPFIITERGRGKARQKDGHIKISRNLSNMVLGTYIHGLFDNFKLKKFLLDMVAGLNGIDLKLDGKGPYEAFKQKQYDRLAALFRENMDMKLFYKILNDGL
ncbi:MAG: cobyric acid synthase [Actinomycetota bacterium]